MVANNRIARWQKLNPETIYLFIYLIFTCFYPRSLEVVGPYSLEISLETQVHVIFPLPHPKLMTVCLIRFESEAITKWLLQSRHGDFIQGRKEERREKAIEFAPFSQRR